MRWFSYSLLVFSFCAIHGEGAGPSEHASKTTSPIKVNGFLESKASRDHSSEPISKRAFNLSSEAPKPEEKGQLLNETLPDLSSLLLFPILPFLLPSIKTKNSAGSTKDKNGSEARNGDPGTGGFVFFDVTFDTRDIPLENETRFPRDSDTARIENKPLSSGFFFSNFTLEPQKQRNKKRIEKERHSADLLDAFPFFSEDDAFFDPFADFPFRRKPERKLAKQKRAEESRDSKNEVKYFQDAFDEAFLETEKGLEEADPVSKFFQVVDGFLNGNGKREEKAETKGKPQNTKALDSPAIVLDEVVKIGQVHVFDEGNHQDKRKGKRESPRKIFNAAYRRNRHEEHAKKRLERNGKKRMHRAINHGRRSIALLETALRNGSFLHENITENQAAKTSAGQPSKPRGSLFRSKTQREDLTRNITEVLNRFLSLGETGEFDWTERETLERQKSSQRSKRQQKSEGDFEEEYVEMEKKERQVADLNFLFLAITLPTVFVLALLLLACFSSFRVKGKICTKLFKPRQVFVVDTGSPGRGANKTQHV